MLRNWMLGHGYITKPEVTRPYLTYFFISFNNILFRNHFHNEKNSKKSRAENRKFEVFEKTQDSKKSSRDVEILFHQIH